MTISQTITRAFILLGSKKITEQGMDHDFVHRLMEYVAFKLLFLSLKTPIPSRLPPSFEFPSTDS